MIRSLMLTSALFFASAAAKENLIESLNLPDDNTAIAILIDIQGNVLWRGEGEYSQDAGADLKTAVAAALD